jgi:type IV secretory pathway TraG/TraD family ATPase VirD4
MENPIAAKSKVMWGRASLTEDDLGSHFLAVGSSGSGKSLMLRLLMQSVFESVGDGNGIHGLVYDAKRDMLPILSAFVKPQFIKTFSPFDQRGVGWATYKDVTDSVRAIELAHTLVPNNKNGGDDFFRNAVCDLLWGNIVSFILSGQDWVLADLLRVMRSQRLCKRVLKRHPETEFLVDTYLCEPKLAMHIFSSVSSFCQLYQPIAASWLHAKEQLSIEECVANELVVILGNHEVGRTTIQSVNRVLCKIYTDYVLAQPEYTKNRFWFFFDEISEAGPMRHLASFAKLARSKGGRLCIAFQSIAGLQNEKMFGAHVTTDMLSNFSNRFVGRVEDPETARWCSDYIGEQDAQQISKTRSTGPQSSSSVTTSKINQKTVLPSEFLSIEHCGIVTGLSGLFKLRTTDPYWDRIDPQKLFKQMLIPKAEGVQEFIPRSAATQLLQPWSPEREAQFAPRVLRTKRSERPKSVNHSLAADIDPFDDIDLSTFQNGAN